MSDFERYIFQSPATSTENDAQRFERGCKLLMEAIPGGVERSVQQVTHDPALIAKFSASAAAGFVFTRAWPAEGLCGIAVRGVGAAMGAMTVAELMHTDRLRTLDNAFRDQNKEVLQSQIGSLLADALVMTAGGVVGARLGNAGMQFRTGVPEWPAVVSNDIKHSFGEGVVYESTANGAVLKLGNGRHYIWHEHRPFFQTDKTTGITHFGDGSKLTIVPGKETRFEGVGLSKKDSQIKYEYSAQNQSHFYEQKHRPTDDWRREYYLGSGPLIEQNRNGYHVFHGISEQTLLSPSGTMGGRGRMQLNADGSRSLIMPDRTRVEVAANGDVYTQGIKKTLLQKIDGTLTELNH